MYRVFVTQTAMIDIDRLEDWLLEHGALYGLELGAALADATNTLSTIRNARPEAVTAAIANYRSLFTRTSTSSDTV